MFKVIWGRSVFIRNGNPKISWMVCVGLQCSSPHVNTCTKGKLLMGCVIFVTPRILTPKVGSKDFNWGYRHTDIRETMSQKSRHFFFNIIRMVYLTITTNFMVLFDGIGSPRIPLSCWFHYTIKSIWDLVFFF